MRKRSKGRKDVGETTEESGRGKGGKGKGKVVGVGGVGKKAEVWLSIHSLNPSTELSPMKQLQKMNEEIKF